MFNESSPRCVRVMYDGSCPMCTREIEMYRRLPARSEIEWVDVSQCAQPEVHGIAREVLMQRFHVRAADGTWLVGARAFVHLWQQLPGWRYLAWLARVPGVIAGMDRAYTLFLRWRPSVQRWWSRS